MDFIYKQENNQNIVEAIEEGKIVRVSESYAKREGLPILRKSRSDMQQKAASQETKNLVQKEFRDERSKRLLDYLRKPVGWKEKQVISELIQNFNWQIARKRKSLGMTRKQLAQLIGVDEESIKLLENGLLPSPDFVLINKIQVALKLNLRKDKIDFGKELTLEKAKQEAEKKETPKENEESPSPDIQFIEDE